MKVIYDISVLGNGYYHHSARTGVFRVIENLAIALKRSESLDLSFCAHNTFLQLIQTVKYLESSPDLGNVELYDSDNNIHNLIIARLRHLYPKPVAMESPTFFHKVFNFYLEVLIKSFKLSFINIDAKTLINTDIFHSTFYALPRDWKNARTVKRFISIYDLIPILYPQYMKFIKSNWLRNVVKSIQPDDWVISISHATKNDLCNYADIDPKKIFVTHPAASDMFYYCSDEKQIANARKQYRIPDGPYVLSLSTLEPRKNIDHTIRCFARMVQEQHIGDLNLVLVGTMGWDFNKIFEEISNYSPMRDHIILTGYVADRDLAAIYSGASMFVYPSFYEGFGLPPLEAMQCGVPVITSNTSSLPEVVGDAGIRVDPSDSDALCQSMYKLYMTPSLRAEMSLKSLERAKLFSWDKCAQDTISAYETALRN